MLLPKLGKGDTHRWGIVDRTSTFALRLAEAHPNDGDLRLFRGGAMMDWAERFFHISPDRGSGSFEVVVGIAVAFALAIGIRLLGTRRQRKSRTQRPDLGPRQEQ